VRPHVLGGRRRRKKRVPLRGDLSVQAPSTDKNSPKEKRKRDAPASRLPIPPMGEDSFRSQKERKKKKVHPSGFSMQKEGKMREGKERDLLPLSLLIKEGKKWR